MKAAVIEQYGNADVVQVKSDLPKPVPAANQVLVQIKAAGINPLDWRIRNGELRAFISSRFPMILGHDGAGIVVDKGHEVSGFEVGDHVFGLFDANSKPSRRGFARPGTCAEYAITREDTLASIPKGVDFIEAAGTPLAALTAYQALRDKAGVSSGQHILINGASGGVGSFAVQLAKLMGAHVTAVCGPDNVARVKALGANNIINYKELDITAIPQQFDIIYDVVANQSASKVRQQLNPEHGIYVSNVATGSTILSSIANVFLSPFGVKQHNLHAWVTSSGKDLLDIARFIETGQLKTPVDQVFPLDEIRQAHRLSESHHAKGKIVISVA